MADTLAPAWENSFDLWDDDHCYGCLDDLLSDFGPARRHLAGVLPVNRSTFTHDDLRDIVREALDNLEDDEDDEDDRPTVDPDVLAALRAMSERLEPHRGCQCGWDLWELWGRDDMDTLIADSSPDAPAWVILGWDRHRGYSTSAPTTSEIWSALNDRDGWRSVTAKWDPATRRMELSFDGASSRWHATVIALTQAQHDLAGRLEECGGDAEEMATLAATRDTDALIITANLWGDEDGTTWSDLCHQHTYVDAAIDAVTNALAPLDADTRAAAALLSSDWSGSFEDLLTAATVVTAHPATAA